ncbi:hypothetical protein EK21DRAFT_86048 [Setomelanomma holmii]|uniref:Uncharacterized protein n=1 Tax=Setomelanomma holmii TaxID=210430 RepID=A0A9P4LSM2_9PLEO|nr:hypothetical protein EK21DRAFT_86048 [Setomelanomma holmii]
MAAPHNDPYCYTRNGTTITSKAYQPCNNSTKASACCGTNHQGAGDTLVADDKCMDNGLCQNFEGFDGTNTATVGPTSSVPSATSASTTSSVVSFTSANTLAATSSHAKDTASGGLSTGAKAGIEVGVAIVVILATAVLVLLLRLRKSKSSKHDQIETSTSAAVVVTAEHEIKNPPQMHVHESGGHGTSELETSPAELGVYDIPHELNTPGHGSQ